MAYFAASKFRVEIPLPKKRVSAVQKQIEQDLAFVALKHKESLISLWVKKKDCKQGGFTLSVQENKLLIDADFIACVKISKFNFEELTNPAQQEWELELEELGVEMYDLELDDTEHRDGIKIDVKVSETGPSRGPEQKKSRKRGLKTDGLSTHWLQWKIQDAIVDLEDSGLEDETLGMCQRVLRELSGRAISEELAAKELVSIMHFEFDSANLDRSIAEILHESMLSDGSLRINSPLQSGEHEVVVRVSNGNLCITALISIPISLAPGISAEDAAMWLEENGGCSAGYLGPWSYAGDSGQSVGVSTTV